MPTSALTEAECADLRYRIKSAGLDETAKAFGLNTTTLLRAAVGLPLHNATRKLIQTALAPEWRVTTID